jgi:hypothetical protein
VRRLVRIDRIVDSLAVLSEGLQPGDAVVVKGQRTLIDGVKLNPQDAARTGEP